MAERRRTKRLAAVPRREPDSSGVKTLASHKYLLVLTNFVDPQIEAEIARLQSKSNKTVSDILLLCLLRFRQIRAVMTRIPKTADAWMNVQLQMVKRKMGPVKYLSDKDIKKIITHVRQINANRHPEITITEDPDLPSCFYWNVEQVGQWLTSIGYSHLKDMFQKNYVSGRKLITIDASALSQMGLKYFKDIQVIAAKIREILKIPRPNIMRALMCKVPFEQYLKQRQWSGESYDDTTFEKFCKENDYPYVFLRKNPTAIIECTRELSDYLSAFSELRHGGLDGASFDHKTVVPCPSVECTVRHILVRDKIMLALINELLEMGLNPAGSDGVRYVNSLGSIFNEGFEELGISPEDVSKRLAFGRLIAEEMLNEVMRTQKILKDMAKFKQFLKDANVSDETVQEMQGVATEFFNSATNVATLLALGQLDLETIFRDEPEFNAFVDGIVEEAEWKLNEMVPEAEAFIDEIIAEAENRVMHMEFIHLEDHTTASVRAHAKSLLNDMSRNRVLNLEEMKRGRSNDGEITTPEMKAPATNAASFKSATNPMGDHDQSKTVGFFTTEIDQPEESLARKLGGWDKMDSKARGKTQDITGSGDTNQETVPPISTTKPSSHLQFELFQGMTGTEDASQIELTLYSMNSDEDVASTNDTKPEAIDPAVIEFVTDHTVYVVVQEGLTRALDESISVFDTRQILLTLEELKSAAAAKSQC